MSYHNIKLVFEEWQWTISTSDVVTRIASESELKMIQTILDQGFLCPLNNKSMCEYVCFRLVNGVAEVVEEFMLKHILPIGLPPCLLNRFTEEYETPQIMQRKVRIQDRAFMYKIVSRVKAWYGLEVSAFHCQPYTNLYYLGFDKITFTISPVVLKVNSIDILDFLNLCTIKHVHRLHAFAIGWFTKTNKTTEDFKIYIDEVDRIMSGQIVINKQTK